MMQSFGRVALAVAVLNVALTAALPYGSDAYELDARDEFGASYGKLEAREPPIEGGHFNAEFEESSERHRTHDGVERGDHHRRPDHDAEGRLNSHHHQKTHGAERGDHYRRPDYVAEGGLNSHSHLHHKIHDRDVASSLVRRKHHGGKKHGKHHGKKHSKHHHKKGRKHHSKKGRKHGHKKHHKNGHKKSKGSHSHSEEGYLAAREYDLEELD